jgi:acyl transferase domain-containing protein
MEEEGIKPMNGNSAGSVAVVGLSCWFPNAASLPMFWEKTLLKEAAADVTAAAVSTQSILPSCATISSCAKEALRSVQVSEQQHKNLLLLSGFDSAAQAKLAQNTEFNLGDCNCSLPQAIIQAHQALNEQQHDLVLVGIMENNAVGFVVMKQLEDAVVQGDHIYALVSANTGTTNSPPPNSSSNSNVISVEASLSGLLQSILSVYHATLVNGRPWIVPGYDEKHTMTRTANLQQTPIFVLQYKDGRSSPPRRLKLLTPRATEIFVMQASTAAELRDKLQRWISYIKEYPQKRAVELSSSMSRELTAEENPKAVRLAIVAASTLELLEKMAQVETSLLDKTSLPLGVFCSASAAVRAAATTTATATKLAFMLPGLGAAYPDMLLDLCLHYPEVREVFDYVDGLALAEGEKTLPSTLLFPGAATSAGNLIGTAMLATMDSAVVTVLLAEWAIYALLSKFGIQPDALIGCSTGEFAAFTMGGVADITRAARMFYQLSVSVARSLPKELDLASMKVNAGIESIKPVLDALEGQLFVTAEFTSKHSIVTGSKQAVAQAAELLKSTGIEFHQLPVAIPYHTPLVEDTVSAQHDEIAQLPLSQPTIPIWSCASTATYDLDVEAMRRATTELFAKTILFERTIKKAQASGIDTFIEVGPRDNLASFATEIFGAPTLTDVRVLRSDVRGRNSITSLNYLLAELFCLGCDVDFEVLFENRETNYIEEDGNNTGSCEQVVISYLEGLELFHKQLMEVQAKVFDEYLASR